jgi:hypothetical protein
MTPEEKPTMLNPKDLIGTNKVPLSLMPATAIAVTSVAMLDGALKYGRDNYRAIGVRASIYVDAAQRHLLAWMEGEDVTSDSHVHHLGHAIACLAILIDAEAAGMLHDDRKIAGGYSALLARLTPLVAELRAQHADKAPHHYTIADTAPEAQS